MLTFMVEPVSASVQHLAHFWQWQVSERLNRTWVGYGHWRLCKAVCKHADECDGRNGRLPTCLNVNAAVIARHLGLLQDSTEAARSACSCCRHQARSSEGMCGCACRHHSMRAMQSSSAAAQKLNMSPHLSYTM